MEDYEKLGVFYLGRPYLMAQQKPGEGLLLYDSKDLVTHAICVGMTGSGKTGLCVSLLEEAAIDGVPSIVIDPKGDLTNLLLTFPSLKPEDFRPWVNEEDAAKKGLSPDDYAAKQADLWMNGLTQWGQSGERIGRLRQNAEFLIYTPGSTAGIPISILKSFAPPPEAVLGDEELLRERIGTTATSLLGILGIEADPIKSREHILISSLLDSAWRAGRNMDIATLIQQIQTPPVSRIGVMDIDSFFPAKDRFGLALSLNNLLAAPGFSTWLEGDPLDIGSILYSPSGKPRVAIFSIAHLSDPERMFFVSLLLNQVLGWMRTQSGTTSLRALVYMDEIFGYFPPVANPPSKLPLLTLLKQARAFGVGVVLATQNPVDLDYKGLSNTGTWFIGRLQTERDKARVMEGLEGAAAATGAKWDRQAMDQTLAGLSNRIFLMNNVHEDAPVVFETRWAMSYLRGPLTRNQIKLLMDPLKSGRTAAPAPVGPSLSALADQSVPTARPVASANVTPVDSRITRPVLPPKVSQYFVRPGSGAPAGQSLYYQPQVLASARISFSDLKSGVNSMREVFFGAPIANAAVPVDWEKAVDMPVKIADLEQSPREPAKFADLLPVAAKSESYSFWAKDFANWLCRTQKVDLWRSPSFKIYSRPGESDRDFRIRLQQQAREQRDEASEKLRQKYAPKIAALEEQRRRALATVEREKEQAKQQQLNTALSFGATILGGLMGRKVVNSGSIGRAKSAMSGVGRSMKERQDVERAQDTVQAVQQRLQQLEADFKADTDALTAKMDPLTEQLEQVSIRPSKTEVAVELTALGWLPYWQDQTGNVAPAW